MRILHTADWHLGKIVNGFSMLEDQEKILDQITNILKDEEVDLLMVAGDIYDRGIPPKEAVDLLDETLTHIIFDLKIPVLMISGNHDSGERLNFASSLLSQSGLYIEGVFQPTTRCERFGDVSIYMMPFADHIEVRQKLNMEDEIKNLEEAVEVQIKRIVESPNFDPDQINILMMHGYVINQDRDSIEESDSERPLSIGTAENVDAKLLDSFDYVALGHLHGPQKVGRPTIRYSGSPLKYSKSEANHKKKVYLIDTEESLEPKEILLRPEHDLRVIRGEFGEITKGSSDDYIFFELTDDSYKQDAMNKLRLRYPNAMGIEYVNLKPKERLNQSKSAVQVQKMQLDDLFKEFYEESMDRPLDGPRLEIVQKHVNEVLKEDD